VSMPVTFISAGVAESGAAGSGVTGSGAAGPAGPDSVATAAGTTWRRRATGAVTRRGVTCTWLGAVPAGDVVGACRRLYLAAPAVCSAGAAAAEAARAPIMVLRKEPSEDGNKSRVW